MIIDRKSMLLNAARTGDLDILKRYLPDWNNGQSDPSEAEDEEWSFLEDLNEDDNHDAFVDERGYNLLDLLFEEVRRRISQDQEVATMAPAALELIVSKGLRPSQKTLQVLLPANEFAALGRVQTKVHIFRRTIGIFARAVFQFSAFDEGSELLNQKMATWGMYGIAYILNHDPAPTRQHMTPRGNRIHPALFTMGAVTPNGPSKLAAFVNRMLQDEVMTLDLIKDGHAWRMLNELSQCGNFEEDVQKIMAEQATHGPALQLIPLQPPRTVLLVEDNNEQRLKMAAHLAGRGFKVMTAASGEKAEEVFKRHQSSIDLVLSDLEMPGIDGLGLLQLIRGMAPKMPLILNTVPPQLNQSQLQSAIKRLGNAVLIPKFDEPSLHKAVEDPRMWRS